MDGWVLVLGAYEDEEAAAHTYDLAALKYWGTDTILNFPVSFHFSCMYLSLHINNLYNKKNIQNHFILSFFLKILLYYKGWNIHEGVWRHAKNEQGGVFGFS